MISGVVTRVQRLPERRSSTQSPAPVASAPGQGARSPVFGIFVWSRVAIWAAAVFSYFTFQPNRHPSAFIWDDPKITHELGILTDVWARWDSVWFLRIAHYGYVSPSHADSPHPLYPATVAGLGRDLRRPLRHRRDRRLSPPRSPRSSCTGSPRRGSAPTTRVERSLGSAVFPMSLFLIAIYSESLFLLLSLAAFVLAERGKWVGAWVSVMLAILTRAVGFALLPPLLLLAWRAEHRKRALAGVLIPLAGFSLYPIYLQWKTGDGWAFKNPSRALGSGTSPMPGRSVGSGTGCAPPGRGIEQFASGSHTHVYCMLVQDTDPARRDDQPRGVRLPRPLRLPDDRRLAKARSAVRPVRSREPGDPAQRAEQQMATPLDAAVRARDLPLSFSRSRSSAAALAYIR